MLLALLLAVGGCTAPPLVVDGATYKGEVRHSHPFRGGLLPVLLGPSLSGLGPLDDVQVVLHVEDESSPHGIRILAEGTSDRRGRFHLSSSFEAPPSRINT